MTSSNTQFHLAPREEIAFSHAETQTLETLRRRYGEDHDLFSPFELAQLQFLRWLVRTERLVT
jgi:hypothetical protein